MSVDLWHALFVLAVSACAVTGLVVGVRAGVRAWSWWGPLVFVLGWLAVIGVVFSRLDSLGEDGSLSAHVVQHIALSDLAAPLLLLGLAPVIRQALATRYDRVRSSSRRGARFSTLALSPIGAAVLWSIATYVWLVPAIHRQAIAAGPVHVLDHASFLIFGLLVWLAAFDFRRVGSVASWDELVVALRTADLPWWGRHVYAMATRFALLPAMLLIWLAPSAAYFLPGQFPPGGLTRHEDQVQAASLMLGFEMLLFGFAIVLLFIFASVSEGRRRQREAEKHS